LSFALTILGSNSATPAYGRNHTAQYLQIQNDYFLIDCGEGTQMQMSKFKCKPLKLSHIFISHMHGDHYLGLMGLLFTMHLLRREKELHIFGPPGLAEIITLQLKHSDSRLNYKIVFHKTDKEEHQLVYENKKVEVWSFPLQHRIPCTGFLFKEKQKPVRLNKEKLPEDITLAQIGSLKKGEDVFDESGKVLHRNKDLTLPPRKSRTYAYCSDTIYDERLVDYIKGVDLLYHEATFLIEREIWANKTFHSTTEQAAQIAKKSNVGKLIIGHFSARYKELDIFLEQTKQTFPNSVLAIEGNTIEVED